MSATSSAVRAASTSTVQLGDLSKDVTLANPPSDSISALSWSPTADHLAIASWDNKVRVYDITRTSSGTGVASINFSAPALDCDWSQDGRRVVGGGIDKTAHLIDLGAGVATAQQVGAHDEPIRSVRFLTLPGSNDQFLITGSWDKSLRYWDLRQAAPIATLNLSGKIYSMDTRAGGLVAATSDNKVHLVDLSNPTQVAKVMDSPLKMQTRSVSCFKDTPGFGISSVEGRCGLSYLEKSTESPKSGSTSITEVYAVNAIDFHPTNGSVFSTAGSDGKFTFWDRDVHARIRAFPAVGGSISATAWNCTGRLFAYGVSYDWSKGFAHNTPQYPNKVVIHPVMEDEITTKAGNKK